MEILEHVFNSLNMVTRNKLNALIESYTKQKFILSHGLTDRYTESTEFGLIPEDVFIEMVKNLTPEITEQEKPPDDIFYKDKYANLYWDTRLFKNLPNSATILPSSHIILRYQHYISSDTDFISEIWVKLDANNQPIYPHLYIYRDRIYNTGDKHITVYSSKDTINMEFLNKFPYFIVITYDSNGGVISNIKTDTVKFYDMLSKQFELFWAVSK